MRQTLLRLTLALMLLPATALAAPGLAAVDALLQEANPPPGVVFEVVTGDARALEALLPRAAAEAARLRARFPDLPIAVLTHGSEQFALLTQAREAAAPTHAAVRSLVAADVPVQVCGNYADLRGHGAGDFPDYVEVASSATTELAAYRARGFEVIPLRPARD
jgi:intracellular sulfur oxidation DsrE/DsrF family protein